MAVFGNENVEESLTTIDDYIKGGVFQCPANGTADSIDAYLDLSGIRSGKVKCAIYNYNGGTNPSFIAETVEYTLVAFPVQDEDGWYTFNFVTPPTLVAGNYYCLVAWYEDPAGTKQNVSLRVDTSAGNIWINDSQAYNGWPDPLDDGEIVSGFIVSIHCNYTPSAPSRRISPGITRPSY